MTSKKGSRLRPIIKQSIGIGTGALALLIFGIYLGRIYSVSGSSLLTEESKSSPLRSHLSRGLASSQEGMAISERIPSLERGDLSQFLNQESEAVGRTLEDSSATLTRVKKFSQKLSSREMERLKSVALDGSQTTDRRMLSVYMLAQVESPVVIDFLKIIISAPIKKSRRKSRHYEDELVIRAQAIEGFKKFQTRKGVRRAVMELARGVEESFLVGRLNKILSER
ncbi:hypothetical protein OAQ84_00825 [Bdellovibrionales bacterium]|nr:hypothetical protein [Bdellovibrionales bacterium]